MKINHPKINYLIDTTFHECTEYQNGYIKTNEDNVIIENQTIDTFN